MHSQSSVNEFLDSKLRTKISIFTFKSEALKVHTHTAREMVLWLSVLAVQEWLWVSISAPMHNPSLIEACSTSTIGVQDRRIAGACWPIRTPTLLLWLLHCTDAWMLPHACTYTMHMSTIHLPTHRDRVCEEQRDLPKQLNLHKSLKNWHSICRYFLRENIRILWKFLSTSFFPI